MKALHLPVVLLLGLPISGMAATWVSVAGNDDVEVFVDTDSIRKNGNRVKTWLKFQWVKSQNVPGSYPTKLYRSERQLQVSDCRDRTLAIAQGVFYGDMDGTNAVGSYTNSENSWSFSEAAPETIGETLINFACKSSGVKKK
jgi:hypothetical protein